MLDLFSDIDSEYCDIADLYEDDFTEKFWMDCFYHCKKVKFTDLPHRYQTKDFMIKVRNLHPEFFCKFPLIWLRRDEIIRALQTDGLQLQYINAYDKIFYEVACKQNGLAYEYVPKYAKTEELLKISVTSNPRALLLVDKEERNAELYIVAVHAEKSKLPEIDYDVIQEIPKEYIDFEIPPKQKKKKNVAEEKISTNLARYYSTSYGYNPDVHVNVNAIPKEYITEDFWLNYVCRNNYSVISEVPPEFVNDKLRCAFYEENKNATFEDLSDEMRTEEYCRKVFNRTKDIRKLPFGFITIKEVIDALKSQRKQIAYIIEHKDKLSGIDFNEVMKSLDFLYVFDTIPPEYITDEVLERQINLNPDIILKILGQEKKFPISNFISHLHHALSLKWKIFTKIPDKYKDYDICLNAVKFDPRNVFLVPEKYRDEQICKIVCDKLEMKKLGHKKAAKFAEFLKYPSITVINKALEYYSRKGYTEKEDALLAKIQLGK